MHWASRAVQEKSMGPRGLCFSGFLCIDQLVLRLERSSQAVVQFQPHLLDITIISIVAIPASAAVLCPKAPRLKQIN